MTPEPLMSTRPAISPDGSYVAFGNSRHGVHVLSVLSTTVVHKIRTRPGPLQFEFSADSRQILLATANELLVFSAAASRMLHKITLASPKSGDYAPTPPPSQGVTGRATCGRRPTANNGRTRTRDDAMAHLGCGGEHRGPDQAA